MQYILCLIYFTFMGKGGFGGGCLFSLIANGAQDMYLCGKSKLQNLVNKLLSMSDEEALDYLCSIIEEINADYELSFQEIIAQLCSEKKNLI